MFLMEIPEPRPGTNHLISIRSLLIHHSSSVYHLGSLTFTEAHPPVVQQTWLSSDGAGRFLLEQAGTFTSQLQLKPPQTQPDPA